MVFAAYIVVSGLVGGDHAALARPPEISRGHGFHILKSWISRGRDAALLRQDCADFRACCGAICEIRERAGIAR
jgi:hypothetical protein